MLTVENIFLEKLVLQSVSCFRVIWVFNETKSTIAVYVSGSNATFYLFCWIPSVSQKDSVK